MEIMVMGAGIVGISTALALQKRGQHVVLMDRNEPAKGASFGNAGMIHGEAVFPLAFPRNILELAKFGLNQSPALHYHLRALPALAPFLYHYWKNSAPEQHRKIAHSYAALTLNSRAAHETLIPDAKADHLIRDDGCYLVFRSEKEAKPGIEEAELSKTLYGVDYTLLEKDDFAKVEPSTTGITHALHWHDSLTVTDPYALTKSYYDLFIERGGQFVRADAHEIFSKPTGWQLQAQSETIDAEQLVVCLGARSNQFTRSLGLNFPLAAKRGYHAHFKTNEHKPLNNTLIDHVRGYSLAPMQQGIRLATGIEFANIDAPPSPAQVPRAIKSAQEYFPLGERIKEDIWMGERPCLPDMLPIIGPAPDRNDLWLGFGHGHQGFTMGPVTGELLAQMMLGEETQIDPTPYSAARFL